MHLYVVAGPTCSGTTRLATAMSRRTGAPVVSLDRLQVVPELAVTSGRPTAKALIGTRRLYSGTRLIGDGEPTAALVADGIHQVLKSLTDHPLVICEGGSISLHRALFGPVDPLLGDYARTFDMVIPAPHAHVRAATRRAAMVVDAPRGLWHELQDAWQHRAHRLWLSTVVGFNAALDWAQRFDIRLDKPMPRLSRYLRAALITRITTAHLAYARHQLAAFQVLYPALPPPPTRGADGRRLITTIRSEVANA